MKKYWILFLLSPSILILALVIVPVGAQMNPGESTPASGNFSAKIESSMFDTLQAGGTADFDVVMTEQADLSAAYAMTDWNARGEYVYQTLLETAARTQAPVLEYLQQQGLKYQSFFAGNEVIVSGGMLMTATSLSAMPEVGTIRPTVTIILDDPPGGANQSELVNAGFLPLELPTIPLLPTPLTWLSTHRAAASMDPVTDWGIIDTKADQVWSLYNDRGEGVVVANIDTGVQWDHPALVESYKCGTSPNNPACWSDPTNECGSGGPCDRAGHGTHTMGTMVGSDDPSLPYTTGMAPHATWIACKAFVGNSGSEADLLACADWILAPAGKPSNRPNIVNNSWGNTSTGGDTWYLSKVQAWRASGIFPAFAAGNSGSGCNTLRSPGDYQQSFATAAHDSSRTIADFSSRGDSAFGHDPYTKPNLSAPGVNIMSAWPGSQWNLENGTSMASPHTAGAVALLWTCDPSLGGQIDQTFQLLQNNTNAPTNAGNCGAPPDGQGNRTYGYGYLDILNTMQADPNCHANGTLKGQVTSGGNPLAGVEVQIVNSTKPAQKWTINTDASGNYSQVLPANTYNIYYTKYGYVSDSYLGTAVYNGGITTRNISLTVADVITLDGYVTDQATGLPLAANILFSTAQFSDTASASPMDGHYSLSVDASTLYHIQVDAVDPGYREQNFDQTFDNYSQSRDFALEADPVSCSAPGYRNAYTYYQDFETSTGGFISGGTKSSWAWGAPTSGPGRAHSENLVLATNLNGNYNNSENSTLISPSINLSSLSGKGLYLDWWQWVNVEKNLDSINLYVSKDGGANWTQIYTFSDVDESWKPQRLYLDSSYAVPNFRFYFRMISNATNTFPGWYIDDIGIGAVSTLNESFEGASFPPAGWSVYDMDRDTNTWTVSTSNPYTTPHNVAVGPNHHIPLIQDDWLVTPDIYMSTTGNQTLSFWDYTANLGSEHHILGYCDEARPGGCGSPPYNYSLFDGFWPAQSSWTQRTLGFSSTQGHEMRIAWNYYGSGGTWHIDAVSLQNGILLDACRPAPAGPITTNPTSLQATVNLGEAPASQVLQITNSGSSTTGYGISEYSLGFSPALSSQVLHIPALRPGVPSLSPLLLPGLFQPAVQKGTQAADGRPSAPPGVDMARLITGVPAYALAWKSSYNYALYSFNTATPNSWTEVGEFGNHFFSGADFLAGDTSKFYALDLYNNHFYSLSTSTAAATDLGSLKPVVGQYWGGLTGGIDGKLYAASTDCHHSEVYTIDPATVSATPLFDVTNAPCMVSIAMNAKGEMYGLEIKSDVLVRIDLSSGFATVVGPLGYDARFNQNLTFDQMSGVLYWAAFNNSSGELRVIDPTTGASARVDSFPGPTWVSALLIPGNGGSDLPWLSEAPTKGVLAAGAGQAVSVTFTPPPLTTQPGIYSAQLHIGSDSTSGTVVVPVTMTATIPATWGYLHGLVSGLGPCDAPAGPLPYALVQIYTSSDVLVGSTQTDASGVYNYALLAGSYKVKASLLTYLPLETGAVSVPGSRQMLNQNFTLRRNLPCLAATPTSLTGDVFAGNTLTLSLTISNTGGGVGSAVLMKSLGTAASVNLIQDPSFELYTSSQSPWEQYSLNFGSPLRAYPSGASTPLSGDVFAWFGGYGGAVEESYTSQTVVLSNSASAGLVFWLAMPNCANGTGDYLEVTMDGTQLFKVDGTAAKCGDPAYYPQLVDVSAFANGLSHSLKFFSHTSGGSISNFLVDDVSIEDPGWGRVLWLSTSPGSVTIPPGTNQVFDVAFQTGENTPGTYAAMLTVVGAPQASLNIPTSMVLGAPPTNLTAESASQTQINLNWQDNSSIERFFFVERSANGSTGWTVIDKLRFNIHTYPDGTIPACNTTEYYRVRALTAGGYSAYTNVAHATSSACSPLYDIFLPLIRK